ncbi:MAG: LysM peptidoglycan-binding domain-containing protein [Gammaproteobacteria bacterium]|nr:LysM peptidoglycan-binding domain-containing protein [Gammaproteobacteria bacterium]
MRIIRIINLRAFLSVTVCLLVGCARAVIDEPVVNPTVGLAAPATVPIPEPVSIPPAEPEPAETVLPPKHEDIWDRVRAGFALPNLNSSRVDYYENWYRSRPEFLRHLSARANRYLFHIIGEVEKRGMPTEIALLPAVESAFKPKAYSRAHASGLWQFIPVTGRRFGLKQNWWYDERRDVLSATRAALDYLQLLHEQFDGDWFLALAAYNAGEYRVSRAVVYNRKRRRPVTFEHLRLKNETKAYVPKLLAFRNLVVDSERLGLPFRPIPNQPYFAEVKVDYQIDLRTVVKLAGIERNEFFALNPGFKRWATDPTGPHRLLVPIHAKSTLEQQLAALPPSRRMRWDRHRIRSGDTLSGIAKRYGVDVAELRRSNRLKGNLIRAGHDLIIPVSSAAINTEPRGNRVFHQVQSGDTLWMIARKYRVYIKQLTKWNALRANDVLRPGQRIVVYRN